MGLRLKKVGGVLLVLSIIVLISASSVSAIGIKWFTEDETINENTDVCIPYGVYNPSGRDIKAKIGVEGELKQILSPYVIKDKIIKAGTSSKNAETILFCFNVPRLYAQTCLFKDYICEQKCEEEVKTYKGEIMMSEAPISSLSGTSGSGATIAASAPLKLTVQCRAHRRDWGIVYITLMIIILILLAVTLYRRYRAPKIVRYKEQLKKLQEKIKKEKQNN
jgi:hypothetical protein